MCSLDFGKHRTNHKWLRADRLARRPAERGRDAQAYLGSQWAEQEEGEPQISWRSTVSRVPLPHESALESSRKGVSKIPADVLTERQEKHSVCQTLDMTMVVSFRSGIISDTESWVGRSWSIRQANNKLLSLYWLLGQRSRRSRGRGSRWTSMWVAIRQCSGLDKLATGLRVACDFSRWDSKRVLKSFASEMKRTLSPEQVWSENRKRMKWFICITSCEIRKTTVCI